MHRDCLTWPESPLLAGENDRSLVGLYRARSVVVLPIPIMLTQPVLAIVVVRLVRDGCLRRCQRGQRGRIDASTHWSVPFVDGAVLSTHLV